MMVRILSYTRKLTIINTTEESIFVNISADSNPFRGIIALPGRTNICICGFVNRRERLRSKQPLHVRIKPRPTDVIQNVKITRKIYHQNCEEKLILKPKILIVSTLRHLSSATIPVLSKSDQLSEYGLKLEVYNKMHSFRIQYWECIKSIHGEISHWWVNIKACECEAPNYITQSDTTNGTTLPNLYNIEINNDDSPHHYANYISLDSDLLYHR